MPVITLNDGTRLYVEDDSPEAIKKAEERFKRLTSPDQSVLGELGRGIGAGLISIPQGLTELATTGVDLFFNTDLTDDVNEYFESIKPEVEGDVGKTAQFITQFGVPGLGTVGLLSKASKAKQILGAAAVDGAVATDDVQTLTDVFFDSESDEDRLARLNGAEKASARLMERLGVIGETAGIMLTAPAALGLVGKTAGLASDMIAPLASPVAKALAKGKNVEGDASLANNMFGDFFRKNFTFAGRKPNDLVAQLSAAKTAQLGAIKENVETTFNQINKDVELATKGGNLGQQDALNLSKNIQDFMAPQSRLGFERPELLGRELADASKELQAKALRNIKSYEGVGNKIDYKALGIDENLSISKMLEENRNSINLLEKEILDLSTSGDDQLVKLFIPDEVKNAIAANQGTYGSRSYKAFLDAGYTVPQDLKENALREMQQKMGISRIEAETAFDGLLNPGPKNKAAYDFETPNFLVEGLQFGSLKGRTLNNLPQVRKALGEVTGYGKNDWKEAIANTALATQTTMAKLGSLVGKSKMFDDIKILNDNAQQFGQQKFLKDFRGQLSPGQQLPDEIVQEGIKYKKFSENAGSLKDLYAQDIFHDAIMGATTDLLANTGAIGQSIKGLLALKAGTQYGKTVLSPTTQIRNFTSIPFFALMNGNLGASGRFVDAVNTVFAGLFDPSTRALKRGAIFDGKDYGIIQRGGAVLDEITTLARYATEDSSIYQKVTGSELGRKAKKLTGIETFEKAYSMSDDAARMFAWNAEQAKLKNAIKASGAQPIPVRSARATIEFKDIISNTPNGPVVKASDLTGEALEKFVKAEAAEITLNTVPTYSRVPDAVKAMKYFPLLGNFVAFPSEIIRNTANTLARASTELASGNSELAKIGARRLAGAATVTMGLPTALVATGNALTGVDQEKIDAYKRSFAAPWDKTATLIPTGSDKNGNPTGFYNFSYTNPYDYLQRPVKALMMEVMNGNRNERSLLDTSFRATTSAASELFSPFYEPSLGINTFLQAYNGETDTGRTIWNDTDTEGDKLLKSIAYITDEIAPSVVPFNISADPGGGVLGIKFEQKDFPRVITSSIFGSTDGQGEDKLITKRGTRLDPAETMVQAFSGLKVVKPQIEKSLRYKGFGANEAIRNSSNEFNRVLRSSNLRDAEDFVKSYIRSNEGRYNSLRDLYTAIEDARLLGLDSYKIDRELARAKVSNRELVMQGIFKPIELQEGLLSEALRSDYNKARQPVPIEKLYQLGMMLGGQDLVGSFNQPTFSQPQPRPQDLNIQPIATRTPSVAQPTVRNVDALRQEEINKLLGLN
jgi:hypothetical protein